MNSPSIPSKKPNQENLGDSFLNRLQSIAIISEPKPLRGQITSVVGMLVKAVLPGSKIGELCELKRPGIKEHLDAEVLGFTEDCALIMPLGDFTGLSLTTEVIASGKVHQVGVGPGLLGRVLDGLGRIMDHSGIPFVPETYYNVIADSPDPLERSLVKDPLSLGIRAIDGLLTCGEGQRMGIFAAAGGGKSTLLAQIVSNTEADVIVMALIGERGREVREALEMTLTPESRLKTVMVVSTSDRPALERVKSAYVATAVAEYFRDQGKKVLLLMDSVTRFARAQRLIGLATGEPPARRGYPPSVFSILPQLLERAGPGVKGSITALYTVLVEGDDMNEPIADEVRSILDGHIILSRKLAASNHYPAIDILASISRVMTQIVQQKHRTAAGRFRELLSKYQDAELLLKIGEYKSGNDPITDEAIAKNSQMNEFLRQGPDDHSTFAESIQRLERLV
ncbi:MAG: type III secretion system ATPase SctN [Chthoniobacterales bacterium]